MLRAAVTSILERVASIVRRTIGLSSFSTFFPRFQRFIQPRAIRLHSPLAVIGVFDFPGV
jgi:hypothetical protein